MLRHNATRELPPTPRRLARLGARCVVRRDAGRAGPPGRAGRRRPRRTTTAAADRRHAAPDRALGQGRGAARRPRDPAAVRRERDRPLLRPGLRAGPGPVLRDGLPPPRDGGPDQRAARPEHGRDRHVHPHHGLAPRRRPGVRTARARDAVLPRLLQRRRQRLPQGPFGDRALRGVHRARARRSGLRARAVVRGRLPGLAQGDGVGPPRQHGPGDPAHQAGRHPDAGAGRGALPALPLRPQPADRRDRRVREAGCPRTSGPGHRRAAGPGRRTPGGRRHPRADRPRQRRRLQQLGGLGRAHRLGQAAARQRPAPGRLDARGLVPDGPALHDRRGRLPLRRQRVHLRRRARRGDRAQPPDRLGVHQPRPRRHRPLPGEGDRPDLPLRRQAGAAHPARRGDPGRRRGIEADHRALDPARSAAVRRLGRAVERRCQRPGTGRRPASRQRLRRGAVVDGADPASDGRRHLRLRRSDRLGAVPRGGALLRRTQPEPRVRRHRRQHRLPGARRDPDPQGRPQRGLPGGRLAPGERLDRPLRALRRAAHRAQPRRGVHRHRQPGGHRPGLPLPPHRHPRPRLPQPADPPAAEPPGSRTAPSSTSPT